MAGQRLAAHETMELHELLTFESVCMTKCQGMQPLVTDDGLKSIMQRDIAQSAEAIKGMQGFLQQAQQQAQQQ